MKRALIFSLIIALLLTTTAFAYIDTNNHWSKETVKWGIENEIVQGYPDGTFKPDNTVTEAEFLAMLLRAYKVKGVGNFPHWADPYYGAASLYNYPVNGSDDISKRNQPIIRTHVAEIIAGTQGTNYTGRDAIHYLLKEGLAKGKDPNNITIANFEGKATLTRAEAVQFVKNVLETGVEKLQKRPIIPSPRLPVVRDTDKIVAKNTEKPKNNTGKSDVEHDLPTKIEEVSTMSGKGMPEINRYISYQYNELFLDSIKIEENGVSGKIPTPPEGFYWSYMVDFEYKPEFDPNPARVFPYRAMDRSIVPVGEFLAKIPMDKITEIIVDVGLGREADGVVDYMSKLDVLTGNISHREALKGNIK